MAVEDGRQPADALGGVDAEVTVEAHLDVSAPVSSTCHAASSGSVREHPH